MKSLILSAALVALAAPAFAMSHGGGLPEETVNAIMEKLAAMNCQMDPDDIEAEDEGYDLDDVICEGGQQFDILLDMDFNEVSRRAE
ncbi:PepSY domain-containing protein [Mangrovicoccus ximenensis]|uniref:PepSY domain-containing protein n=1 Tax=Mangrovicoccus ximenensis TaxID=1911570 RepID=UPI000D353B49|nr:PepSY domain-containing protein [Mangrovicoccus ximenensis]